MGISSTADGAEHADFKREGVKDVKERKVVTTDFADLHRFLGQGVGDSCRFVKSEMGRDGPGSFAGRVWPANSSLGVGLGERDGDDLAQFAYFAHDAANCVGANRDDFVVVALFVGVIKSRHRHPAVVSDSTLAKERQLHGRDQNVLGGFLRLKISRFCEVHFFGEDVILHTFPRRHQLAQKGNGRERRRGFALFAKANLRTGDPLLK